MTEVYGDIDSGTFTEKGGIDFQLITVLTPGGLVGAIVILSKRILQLIYLHQLSQALSLVVQHLHLTTELVIF